MSTMPYPVSDMLATVKSREVQRAMMAEMAGNKSVASRHYLAAGHLELVLAEDYTQAGAAELALRSRLGAASCFWRAGEITQARSQFTQLIQSHPDQTEAIRQVLEELEDADSAQAS